MSYKAVRLMKDDSSHYYLVPEELADDFHQMLEDGEEDEYEAFEEKYGEYRTGGDPNSQQLYIKQND